MTRNKDKNREVASGMTVGDDPRTERVVAAVGWVHIAYCILNALCCIASAECRSCFEGGRKIERYKEREDPERMTPPRPPPLKRAQSK